MIVLTIILLAGAGWPFCRILDPDGRADRLIGESLLFGSGLAAMVMLVLATGGIRWTRASIGIPLAAIALGAVMLTRGRASLRQRQTPAATGSRWWHLLDALTLLLILAHLLFSSLERPYEWDFFAIWGFKGHLFFTGRSIPWSVFADPGMAWMQRGHPLFAPLLFDLVAIVAGRWRDSHLGLLATAFGASAILIVRGLVAEEHASRVRRSALTLAVTPAALSLWIGLAEPFLIAFASSGVLLIRRGLRLDSRRSVMAGSALLGCAVMTKNEGLAFLLSAAVAMLLTGSKARRRVIDMWPAIAVALPWFILRSHAHLGADLLTGRAVDRIDHLRNAGEIMGRVFHTPVLDHVFWWAALAALLLCYRRAWTAERFLIAVIAFQFLADVAQNFVVPWDPLPHISFSWNRILDQMAMVVAFTAATLLLERSAIKDPLPRTDAIERVRRDQ